MLLEHANVWIVILKLMGNVPKNAAKMNSEMTNTNAKDATTTKKPSAFPSAPQTPSKTKCLSVIKYKYKIIITIIYVYIYLYIF